MAHLAQLSSIFNGLDDLGRLGELKLQLEAREREMAVPPETPDKAKSSARPTLRTLQRRYHRIFSQRATLISLVDRLSNELYAVGAQLTAAEYR